MRIISGKHRGLNLNSFDFIGTRPTTDKVREAIFSKIQFNIPESNCLDLFGGTGAMTIELLSRGAKNVCICDNNFKSINLIKENLAKAKENPTILKGDFKKNLKLLSSRNEKFDIIILDPPYNSDYGETSIGLINYYNLLNDGGIIIFECDKNKSLKVDNFEILDEKNYGNIKVYFLNKKGE